MSGYRVAPGPLTIPSRLALSKSHATIEGALAVMGEGVVIDPAGDVAAFHERHLPLMERLAALRATTPQEETT